MKKTKQHSHVTSVRNFLALLLVLVVVGSSAGFYFGLQLIKAYSVDVSHLTIDANASGKSFEQLSILKQQLSEKETLISKANKLFSTPTTYQTQTLKDISKYAADAGLSIASIDSESTQDAAGPITTTTAANYSETITLDSPVSYAKFLQFLDAIEGNLPKMQITGISIGRPANQSGDQITTKEITITVATK
jgi:hypothetical protein